MSLLDVVRLVGVQKAPTYKRVWAARAPTLTISTMTKKPTLQTKDAGKMQSKATFDSAISLYTYRLPIGIRSHARQPLAMRRTIVQNSCTQARVAREVDGYPCPSIAPTQVKWEPTTGGDARNPLNRRRGCLISRHAQESSTRFRQNAANGFLA